MVVREPTSEECDTNATVEAPYGIAFAAWYPQMGGYVAKCVVVTCPGDPEACFDVYIWHDGQFPFSDDDETGRNPAMMHHCMAEQFIRFGELVQRKQSQFGE